MLSAQQAAAKEEAHHRFDYPARIAAEERGYAKGRDKLPRFRPGMRVLALQAMSFASTCLRNWPPTWPCGVSIGHGHVTVGTLGCLVDTPGARCILSNNHVLAVANAANIGDEILQPGPEDASSSNTPARIATLADFEPLRFGSAVNRMDAAIAALDDVNSAVPDIMTIGPPCNPPIAPFVGQAVLKHGRTTGLTFGSVVDTSFDGIVHYDSGVAYFEDQIVVARDVGPFSERGDSGSLILDSPDAHPVGLLFAGDDSQTIANPIQSVLNRFGATVAVT